MVFWRLNVWRDTFVGVYAKVGADPLRWQTLQLIGCADASAMDGWMVAPTVGHIATLVVAMPLSDMAKVADRSSSNGRRVKAPTVVD